MKTRREKRVALYVSKGLLPFEARILSGVPNVAPYMQMLLKQRSRLKAKATKEKWTDNMYRGAVQYEYEARDILPMGKYGSAEVFALLRWYESEWRNTAPVDQIAKWRSPSAKQSHHQGEFNRKRYLDQKREYNARPEVKEKRRLYRLKNRDRIRETEKKRKLFDREHGTG